MEILVSGVGYVGLVTAVCLAEKGHNITCIDISEEKINMLNKGKSPIFEPGLEELILKNKEKLLFTTQNSVYKENEIIFIGVGTPENQDGSANLTYIYDVCESIVKNIEKETTVIIKSTVPVGTNDKIQRFFDERTEIKVRVVSNPEFLAQGTAVKDTLKASRIIVGTNDLDSRNLLSEIYKDFNIPIVNTDRRSAEMIKYASNDFLALKISFINEIANFCELMGANIEDVTKGMGYDSRIGEKFLSAGIGYGGSCFPKDTKALHWLSNDHGYELKTIKATIEVNENQKYKLFRKVKNDFGDLNNKRIAVLGVTFKPETDDLREAPSVPNIRRLLDEGADVITYDPVGLKNLQKIFGDKIKYSQYIEEAIENVDIIMIFTEWKEIKNFDLDKYKKVLKNVNLYDGRNCYSLEEADEKNINYYSIGRKHIKAKY